MVPVRDRMRPVSSMKTEGAGALCIATVMCGLCLYLYALGNQGVDEDFVQGWVGEQELAHKHLCAWVTRWETL